MRFRRACLSILVLVLAAPGCVKPHTGPNVGLLGQEESVEERYVEMQRTDGAESCEALAERRAATAAAPADAENVRKAALDECRNERGLAR